MESVGRDIRCRDGGERSKEMITPYFFVNDENFITQYGSSKPDSVMQFTGLKDKNGVEVYGGDVIKGRVDLGGKLKRFIGVVDINMPYVTVKGVKQYSWKICQSISDVRLFEVIGNIHENPELLS